MENENLHSDEFHYGFHSAEKTELFNQKLSEIADEHEAYFLNQNSSLADHYVILRNSDRLVFGFKENSVIDQNIKDQCISLFQSIFETDEDI